MRITPLELQQQKFNRSFKGYDREEVEAFLDTISRDFEDFIQENNILKGELAESKKVANELRKRESSISESIIMAQKVIDDMKANSEKEATLIISEAEMKAEKIMTDSQRELTNLKREIQELKKQRIQFESALRSMIEAHLKMIDAGHETVQKAG